MATDYHVFTWPGSGGGGGSSGSQSAAIAGSSSSAYVVFTIPFGSTNYVPLWSITNTVDAAPIFLDGYISAKSSAGFTVTFNAPTDSSNYIFNYAVFAYV